MKKSNALVGLIVASLGLAGVTTAPGPAKEDLGSMPKSIVDLYDMVHPSGMIEIELERDGRILEIEADLSPLRLPAKVLAAAHQSLSGGKITGAEQEINAKGRMWEVKMSHGGVDWEFVIDDAGVVWETERSISRQDTPAAVLAAAARAIPDATFKSAEIIRYTQSDRADEYHVKSTLDGATYKCVVRADGKLLRKVREVRAEIEIPLAW